MNVYTVQTNPARNEGFAFNVSVTVEQNGITLGVIEREFVSGMDTAMAMVEMLEIAEEWYPPVDFTNEDSDYSNEDGFELEDSDDEDSDDDEPNDVDEYNSGFEDGRDLARSRPVYYSPPENGESDIYCDGHHDGFFSWKRG